MSKSIGTKQHTVGRSLAYLSCKSPLYYNLNVFPIGFRSGPVDDVLSNSALAHWKAKLAAVDFLIELTVLYFFLGNIDKSLLKI